MTLLANAYRALAKTAAQRPPQSLATGSGLNTWGGGLGLGSPTSTGMLAQMQAYGSVGWLFAVVSRLAEGTAKVQWDIYRQQGDKRVAMESHDALNLWRHPNPFYTQLEFIETFQQHLELVGEAWWVIVQGEQGGRELWPVRPDRMTPIPSRDQFLAGYVYRYGAESIPLALEDVIFLRKPNPIDPYRGMGVVQAILADLEGERFAATWNRNFFYNSAEPGGIIEFDENLSNDDFEQMTLRWREQHQGVANAHRVGIIERGKWVDRKYTQRDMQFEALRRVNRDAIIGAFGFPKAILGITEDVNRANAEAAELTFARWLIVPRLERIKGSLNERLLPRLAPGQALEFDFANPVPDDRALNLAEAERGFKAGLLRQNEGRRRLGLEDVPDGERYAFEIPGLLPGSGASAAATGGPVLEALPGPKGLRLATAEKDIELPSGVVAAERAMQREWTTRLRAECDRLIAYLDQFRRPDELTDGMQGAGASMAERLLARLGAPVRKLELSDVDGHNWDWYELYYQAVVAELQTAFEAAYVAVGPEWSPTQAQTEAVKYARERGAQLLRLDGDLNLAETTRTRVRTLVADAIEDGQSLGQIQRNLRDEFAFSKRRAETIARTESATALGQGEKIAALAQGRDQKRWITQGDDRVEAICIGNQGAGWIGATELFPSGHDVIPAHPRCMCRTTFRHTPVSDVDPSEGLADDIAAGRDESRGLLAEARCPRCAKLLGKAKPKGLSLWCPRCKVEVEPVEGTKE